jgi:hypothetical protein
MIQCTTSIFRVQFMSAVVQYNVHDQWSICYCQGSVYIDDLEKLRLTAFGPLPQFLEIFPSPHAIVIFEFYLYDGHSKLWVILVLNIKGYNLVAYWSS